MKLGGQFDLTYCSNIHPGESWRQVSAALFTALPQVRAHLNHHDAFGIGLRLSAAAAIELEQPSALATFIEFLTTGKYYVPTINGFPYGAFHGTRVKERVYLPDWRSDERVDYTNRLARVLAACARACGLASASISTVPGCFRAEVRSSDDVLRMAQQLLTHVGHLKRLRDETGITIALALEPEPACFIETVGEAERFLSTQVLDRNALAVASRESGMTLTDADVRRHLGVCLDACHMAVEFEDAAGVLSLLRDAGIDVKKVQVSSALRVEESSTHAARELLAPFADDTYLHQVVICTGREQLLTRFTDLPEAIARARAEASSGEWRVHFHVPIFLEAMSGFGTTQGYLAALLREVARTQATTCLEVETYTWDVLPEEYRTTDVTTAIARELSWARGALGY